MNSKLGHVYLYVSDITKSYNFYKLFLEYLGYEEVFKADWGAAFAKDGVSIWISQTPKDGLKNKYSRRNTGLNHLAFKLPSKEEVLKFSQKFLRKRKIKTLYDTPKIFPEYTNDYFAVFFEDPDRIKLEVAFYS